MMRPLCFLLIFFFIYNLCYSQNDTLFLELKKEKRSLKEQPQFNEVIPKADQSFVKGIPHKLLNKYTLSRYLIFETADYKLTIPTLIGKDTLNRPVFILDRNLNLDFSDDSIKYYIDTFKKPVKELIIEDSIIIKKNGESILLNFKYIFIKPGFINADYKDDNENNFFLMMGANNIYTTTFTVNNKANRIIIAVQSPFDYTKKSLKLYISDDTSDIFKIETSQNLTASDIGDTLLIDGKTFKFSSFSVSDNLLGLQEVNGNSRLTNAYPGFYAYNFTLKDINNRLFNLQDFLGNYILLDFWGTWCEPCKKTTPELTKLYNEFKGKKFIIVSIALEKNARNVEKYVKEKGIKWHNIFQSFDTKNSIPIKFRINEYPTFILIDRRGKILMRESGIDGFEVIRDRIKSLKF